MVHGESPLLWCLKNYKTGLAVYNFYNSQLEGYYLLGYSDLFCKYKVQCITDMIYQHPVYDKVSKTPILDQSMNMQVVK